MKPRLFLHLLALALFASSASADFSPELRSADEQEITADLERISKTAGIEPGRIHYLRSDSATANVVRIECPAIDEDDSENENASAPEIQLEVTATAEEWAPTLYFGLQKLGFLFPHPRKQITPTPERMRAVCGQAFEWKPRLRYRGFHLHTQHPNEWVRGFLDGDSRVAEDTVRWLARNGQNTLNVALLDLPLSRLSASFKAPYQLAHRLGILTGVGVSFTFHQQKSFRLLPHSLLRDLISPADKNAPAKIRAQINALAAAIDFDFLEIELGTTEFTPVPPQETLRWIDAASDAARAHDKAIFVKNHVSTRQSDARFGNFNLLPRFSTAEVGTLPHTVMFYGLEDARAPVYGRTNFADLSDYLVEQARRRPTWYFPETSYWVGMDLDIPLFLTDYLVTRARDLDFLERNGIQGQLVFTSGQELGYWLMDWTTALLVNAEHRGNPWIGLQLLGEDLDTWQRITRFQTAFFKEQGGLALLSASTLLDELPGGRPVHERVLLSALRSAPGTRERQIETLENAIQLRPSIQDVRDEELRTLLGLTWDRMEHSLEIRKGLRRDPAKREKALERARMIRITAREQARTIALRWNRYPEAGVFEQGRNLTSYSFGYGWPAVTLHFWEREEEMVRRRDFSPFFMNIYEPFKLLF